MYAAQLFPKRHILDASKLKEFADDDFKFDENGRVFQMVRKHCGKRKNCLFQAISPFPTVFLRRLDWKIVKFVVWERVKSMFSFSHSVFKRLVLQTLKNQGLFGKGLTSNSDRKLHSQIQWLR